MAGRIAVNPPTWEMGSTAQLPFNFKLSGALAVGEVPTGPSSTLTDVATGASYPSGLVGSPTIAFDGTVGAYVLTQTVGNLVTEHVYLLKVHFTAASGKSWDFGLTILCTL